MYKIILSVRRKPGLTHEAFRDRYESGHVPLAIKHMPRLRRYVRNFLSPVPGWGEATYDCVTEFWFDDREDWKQTSIAYAQSDIGKILAADESEFMDRSSMCIQIADERVSELPVKAKA